MYETLKDIHDVYAPLATDAWGVVGKIHDPIFQHHVLDALYDLDALLPQQDKAARTSRTIHATHRRRANLTNSTATSRAILTSSLMRWQTQHQLTPDPQHLLIQQWCVWPRKKRSSRTRWPRQLLPHLLVMYPTLLAILHKLMSTSHLNSSLLQRTHRIRLQNPTLGGFWTVWRRSRFPNRKPWPGSR